MNQFTYWPFSGLDCCLINAFSVANRFDAIANAFAMKWSLNRFFFSLAYVYNFFFLLFSMLTIGGPSLRKSVCHLVHTPSNPNTLYENRWYVCALLHLNAIQIRLLHPDVDCRHFSVTKCISACVYVSVCVCLCLLVHDRIVMHTSCVFVAVCVCVRVYVCVYTMFLLCILL